MTRKCFSLRFLFAGTPHSASLTLAELFRAGYKFDAVLTREDSPQGRKRILTPSPVAATAAELGIPIIKANKITDEIRAEISKHNLSAAIVVAYGVLLKQADIDLLPDGWWNLHFSILPKYRGAAPIQHALLNGEVESGLSLFKIDSGLDTGDLLATLTLKFETDETAGQALNRFSIVGAGLIAENLPKISSGLFRLVPQIGADASYAPKLTRLNAIIDFNQSAKQIENKIRALNPEPIAYTLLNGENLQILRARAVATDSIPVDYPIGTAYLAGNRVLVSCGEHTQVELIELKPAGKSAMSATDWFRGLKHGATLGA